MLGVRQQPDEQQVVERLTTAKAIAERAVTADKGSSYGEALTAYREVVEILLSEMPNLPPANQAAVHEKCKKYQYRVNILIKALPSIAAQSAGGAQPYNVDAPVSGGAPSTGSAPSSEGVSVAALAAGGSAANGISDALRAALRGAPSAPGAFQPLDLAALTPYELPPDGAQRAVAVATALLASMERGAFVAPGVYVPQGVWMSEVRVAQLEAKNAALAGAVEDLDRVLLNRPGDAAAAQAMAAVLPLLADSRNALARVLPFISAEKRSASKRPSAPALRPDASYPEHIAEAMCRVAQLRPWLSHYSAGGPQADALMAIADHVSAALLPFIMRDLASMLELYTTRMSDIFVQ